MLSVCLCLFVCFHSEKFTCNPENMTHWIRNASFPFVCDQWEIVSWHEKQKKRQNRITAQRMAAAAALNRSTFNSQYVSEVIESKQACVV